LSLYADYLRERLGKHVVERPEGFAVFWQLDHQMLGPCVYIEEIFVARDYRKSGVARAMADEIAVGAVKDGCPTLLGSVDPTTFGAAASMQVLIAYGMVPYGIEGGLVMFKKDLGGV
jgi:predicted GNAT superfamily acetyltransferase